MLTIYIRAGVPSMTHSLDSTLSLLAMKCGLLVGKVRTAYAATSVECCDDYHPDWVLCRH